MPPKPILLAKFKKDTENAVVPSKNDNSSNLEGTEDTEIHAQVHVPGEEAWAWVVLAASFCITMVKDGVVFTFGSLRPDIILELDISDAMASLLNSIASGLHLLAAPLGSAIINKFGFRACAMTGSVICSLSLFTSYFLTTYANLCLFFGVFSGVGYSLINLSSSLILGFYFDKLRSLAMSIATVGGSLGITVLYPLNSYLCHLTGWRSVILFHSGLFGCTYFLAKTFRPLLVLHIVKTETSETGPGPSTGTAGKSTSKLKIIAVSPKSGISQRHINQVKSMISKSSVGADDKVSKPVLEITLPEQEPKKISCWGRLCHWEKSVPGSRPMYRRDAFYEGKIEHLPEYQRSKAGITAENETGLEYKIAVSSPVSARDLTERHRVCPTAVRKILAIILAPQLLKRRSFQFICASAFFLSLGLLVPYSYTQDRTLQAGVEQSHCSLFVSAIGGSNAVGRFVLGALAQKFRPSTLYSAAACVAGLATLLSNISFNVYFQYIICCTFGFCTASVATLRSLLIVELYGLQSLTNGVGVLLMFHGVAIIICTPLGGALKDKFGYTVAFIVAGTFLTLGGLTLAPVAYLTKKEDAANPPAANKVIPSCAR